MTDPYYRGWRKPGVLPPAIGEPADGESLDATSGHYRLFQLKAGHRFSTDDVLTAFYGTSWCPSARTILDLGSGIGSVATIAAWRCPGARLVTVEAQAESVALARKSIRYNGLEDRYEIREGDIRDPSLFREDELFDLVLGSPPYFAMDAGSHGDHPQKIACRFEMRGTVADYALVAAKRIAPGGLFACVFPVQPDFQRERVIAAAREAGLVIVRDRDVVFKEGEAPLVGLFAMMRAEDLPDWFRTQTWHEPPLVIRRRDGSVHPEYSAVKLAFGFPP